MADIHIQISAEPLIEIDLFGGSAGAITEAVRQAGLAEAAAVAAASSANDSALAAAVFTFDVATLAQNADGVIPGGYLAAIDTPSNVELDRFFGAIVSGSGTADVTLLLEGVAVAGPFAVSSAADTTAVIAISIPPGSKLDFLIENVTGAPTALVAKASGLPS